MSFDENILDDFLNDTTKKVEIDIRWKEDDDHSPTQEFMVDILNAQGLPVVLKGTFNGLAKSLSFVVLLKGTGRIYALDLGAEHRNPDTRELVGRKHKHKWTDAHRDKWAYCPEDITETVENISGVWQQFCAEVRLVHNGTFYNPEPIQQELFL